MVTNSPMSRRRKSICILALSPIARDSRVLRQVQYLAPHYDLTTVGYGAPTLTPHQHVRWLQIREPQSDFQQALAAIRKRTWHVFLQQLPALINAGAYRASLYAGRVTPPAYDWGYAMRPVFSQALAAALMYPHDAYHANDWNTLPIAVKAARRFGARVVLDLHEYAPLEFENRPNWWLYEPMIRHMLHKYSPYVDVSMTVAEPIAERYRQEFGLQPLVVMNAPESVSLPPRTIDPDHIRIVHHGVAWPVRKPEVMIQTLALCDTRYTLHLMLLPSDYVAHLRQLANELAPGRVFFHEPVPPEKIVHEIARYDIGFNYIAPTNYNYLVCLPNKFFESIVAGLAVLTGPSPAMATLINQYRCGLVAPTFAPEDMADLLNRTTAAEWQAMQTASRVASAELNAAHEMEKVVQVYSSLFAKG